jgi:hypothetical protein
MNSFLFIRIDKMVAITIQTFSKYFKEKKKTDSVKLATNKLNKKNIWRIYLQLTKHNDGSLIYWNAFWNQIQIFLLKLHW